MARPWTEICAERDQQALEEGRKPSIGSAFLQFIWANDLTREEYRILGAQAEELINRREVHAAPAEVTGLPSRHGVGGRAPA